MNNPNQPTPAEREAFVAFLREQGAKGGRNRMARLSKIERQALSARAHAGKAAKKRLGSTGNAVRGDN